MNISVIIPVYNAEEFLEKSVESALQFPEVKEVILVEDKSPDNSLQVCKELEQKYDRVKLFQHPDKQNHGAGATRNLGLEKAQYDFIAFLDADDYYLPNRFDAEKELFKNSKIEGVFGAFGTHFITEEGKEKFKEKFKDKLFNTVNYKAEGMEIFMGFFGGKKVLGTFFSLITLTVRKSAIEREKLKFNEELRVHQDSDFITKLMYHCYLSTGIIDKPISMRGVHDDNRITNVLNYSDNYYKNQLLIAESKYLWASKQKNMPKLAYNFISLNYKTFYIANLKGWRKYYTYLLEVIKQPKLLKTRYRYHALRLTKAR